jgi:hypothetical protein
VIEIEKGTRAQRRSGRPSRSDALATATELDRQLLMAVSSQRVLTQTQPERLFSAVPGRTLRYRTERLTKLGLLGRSRPYRDRGSAPFHYWPTRVADAFARGEPVPRGGERPEPNPQFLAHAAGLSELYVLLAAQAQTGGRRLRDFRREGDARERFRADGRARALAPDALVDVCDEQDRQLLAFVELDLGTMSHARLKTKAAGYAAYAAEAAWTDQHSFCPCLLFFTTTEARTFSFLKALQALLEKAARGAYYGRRGNVSWFAAAACAHAREPERALEEPCWDDLTLAGGGLTLLDCLNAGRAAYDAAREQREAKQRALESERARLRADPDTRRAYLQEKRLYAHGDHLEQFGPAGETALCLLLHFTKPMSAVERGGFAALARQLADDPLDPHVAPAPVPPTPSDKAAVSRLVASYRAQQQARVAELARRYGEGPKLRQRRTQLATGDLISEYASDALEEEAEHDHRARAEQEQLRMSYLDRREHEARRRKHEASLAARLARGRKAAYAVVDRDLLKICPRCDELVYPPEPGRDSYGLTIQPSYREPARCHFCGRGELDPWQERYLPQLEYGGNYRPARGDLPSSGTAGLMDDPDDQEGGEW